VDIPADSKCLYLFRIYLWIKGLLAYNVYYTRGLWDVLPYYGKVSSSPYSTSHYWSSVCQNSHNDN